MFMGKLMVNLECKSALKMENQIRSLLSSRPQLFQIKTVGQTNAPSFSEIRSNGRCAVLIETTRRDETVTPMAIARVNLEWNINT
jgi:hypothetical protein